MDTRSGLGGYTTPFTANTTRTLLIAGQGGIPASGATAVEVTLTAIDPTVQGVVSGGADGGSTTSLMVYDGNSQGRSSNTAIIPVASDGKIQLSTQSTVNLLVDLQGYYTTGNGVTAPGGYSPVAGALLADTRSGTGVPKGGVGPGGALTIQVGGKGGVPTGAAAAFVSVTTIDNGGMTGWYIPYASDQPRPAVSVNIPPDNVPNATGLQVQLSASGTFTIYMGSGLNTDYVVSVEGYFTAGSSTGSFTPANGRIYDTRVKPHTTVASGQTITVPIGGQQGIPNTGDGLESAAVNVTLITSNQYGHVVAWADGTLMPANYAQLYSQPGTVTNLINVPVGTDGAIEIYNGGTGPMDVVVDLEGFYQATSTTLCAKDALTLSGDTQVGADQGDPTVSAVLINTLGNPINGEVYAQDANGNPVGGTPAATGTIDSGTRLTYHIPASSLTAGQTYTWWIHGYMGDKCAAQATSNHHTFTMGTAPAVDTTPHPGPNTLTLPTSAISTWAAPQGTTCNNLACPLTTGTTKVGSDGTGDWITGLKADLSSIPAGATVNTATLTLASTGCLSGTACDPTTTVLAPATDDISTASTGGDLANLEAGSDSSLPAAADATIDITGLLNDWYTSGGANNKGAILTTTSLVDGTGYTPTITLTYTAATIPDGISQLSAIGGDGGLLATWAAPANTGYVDTTGTTSVITNYTVTAVNSSGQTVATATTGDTKAVLTGLTNGSAYTINVTATNPVGAGVTVTSSSIKPVAVTGGPGAYTGEVNKLANAQDTLTTGAAASTQDAVTQVGGTSATTSDLGATATTFEQSHDTMTNAAQQHSGDATTLTNTLVVPSSDGKTAVVYASAATTATLTDTSTGTTVTVPTNESEDVAFTMTTGTTPTVASSADENAVTAPVTTADPSTAFNATDSTPGDTSTAFTNDPTTGLLKAPDGSLAAPAMVKTAATRSWYHSANLAGVRSWAHRMWSSAYQTPFRQDCTDFVSRALRFGGGMPMIYSPRDVFVRANNSLSKWYLLFGGYSKSWSMADYSAMWQQAQGSPFWRSINGSVRPGDIVYANWDGDGFTHHIGHAGIVDQVIGNNLIIDQHDGRFQDSLYQSWSLRGLHNSWMKWGQSYNFWIVAPGERY